MTAKLPTTAHLEAIANAALQSYLPSGWHIHWLAAKDWEHAVTIWESNDPDLPSHTIELAHPTTPQALFALLHELGHIVDSKAHPEVAKTDTSDTLTFMIAGISAIDPAGPYAECRASRWAKAYMEQHSLFVPANVWALATREMHKEEQAWRDHGHPDVQLSKD